MPEKQVYNLLIDAHPEGVDMDLDINKIIIIY